VSNFTPYQPPQSFPPQQLAATDAAPTPAVYYAYIVYSISMAVLYVACVVGGVMCLGNANSFADTDEDRFSMMFLGGVLIVIGLPLSIIFGIVPLLPRKKWCWIYGIVLISIGLTSACTILPAILLLVFWLQTPAKRYFGV